MADQLLDLTAFAPSSEPVLDLEQFAPPKPVPAKKPGVLIPSVKRTAGQMVGAAGVALEDLGLKTRLPEVGEAIVEANPAQIQKPSDILEKPGTFLGESVSEMLPQLGAYAAGAWSGAKVGGRLGAFLGPKGAVAGAGIGGLVGGLAPIFTQEYGEIRETQKKEGAESIPKALLGATAATALERLGAEKLVGRIVKGGGMDLIKEGVSRPLHMLKQGAIGALVEGPLTEAPQTAIERLAGGAPLADEEAMADYIISAAKGAAGGGVVTGALSGLAKREQPPAPAPTEVPPAVEPTPAGPAEPLSLSEFIRANRAPGATGPLTAAEVKAARPDYEAYKQAFINEQFGVEALTPEQRNQILINQTPLEVPAPAVEPAPEAPTAFQRFPAAQAKVVVAPDQLEVEDISPAPVEAAAAPVQKTRIAEPVVLGEQPAPAPAVPIITPQEAEFLRIAETEAAAPVRAEVQSDPATKVALLKRQRGELLTNREAKLVRDYEKAAPKVEAPAPGTKPKFRGRQFAPEQRRENFVDAYSTAVDSALADLVASGVTVTPNKLKRAASLLKRSAEAAVAAKDDAAGAAILDAEMGKALRGIIPKNEIETFRQKIADAAQAAMPETLMSKAAQTRGKLSKQLESEIEERLSINHEDPDVDPEDYLTRSDVIKDLMQDMDDPGSYARQYRNELRQLAIQLGVDREVTQEQLDRMVGKPYAYKLAGKMYIFDSWEPLYDADKALNSRAAVDAAITSIEEFNANMPAFLRRPGWAIITGIQEKLGAFDTPANIAANAKLEAEMVARGLPFKKGPGKYLNVDQGDSFLVKMSEAEALDLAKRYGQQSVLTNEGYVYQNGSLTPVDHTKDTFGDEARKQDGYTEIDGKAFSLGLDFSQEIAKEDRVNPALPFAIHGIKAVHYSKTERSTLDGHRFGDGIKGAERERLRTADPRLRVRTSFYVSSGRGVFPEPGVGAVAHLSTLNNLYDADADPLHIWEGPSDANARELAVIEAGYAGYLARDTFDGQGAAVVFGRSDLPTKKVDAPNAVAEVPPAPKISEAQRARRAVAISKGYPAGAMPRSEWGDYVKRVNPEHYAALAPFGIFEGGEVVYRDGLLRGVQDPGVGRSRAAVDAAIIAKSDEIYNTIAGMVGTPKDLVVEAAPRVPGGAGMIQFGQLRDVITVSVQAVDVGSVASHEGFHYLDKRVLTGPERRVVRQAFASGSRLHRMLVAKAEAYDAANGTDITSEIRAIPAEARAYGFEFWRRGELEAQGMIAKVFQKLARVMERIRNYVEGLGFTSYEDLFAMIRRGEYAKRDLSGIREFEREVMRSRAQREASEKAFYSALTEAVADIRKVAGKDGTINPAQAKTWLTARQKEGRFKAAELEAVGLAEWLDLQQGKVSVDYIETFVREHGVQVEETMLGAPDGWTVTDSERLDWLETNRDDLSDAEETERQGLIRRENAATPDGLSQPVIPKFSDYQLPGGENYRELLLTLPRTAAKQYRFQVFGAFPMDFATREAAEQYVAHIQAQPELRADIEKYPPSIERVETDASRAKEFSSSHFPGHPNILAHVRFNERTDADGKRVLFLEELQSDWAQKGRKEGFDIEPTVSRLENGKWQIQRGVERTELPPGRFKSVEEAQAWAAENYRGRGEIPSAPFVTETKAWVALALKRMIRYAAENGFDRVAWTTGEQQAARYDLSKQVDKIVYFKNKARPGGYPDGTYNILVTLKDSDQTVHREGISIEQVEADVGKDIAKQVADNAGIGSDGKWYARDAYHYAGEISGAGLKVGGEGMKAFYDRIVPQVANELLKKFGGGKVGEIRVALAEADRYLVIDKAGEVYSAETARWKAEKKAEEIGGTVREQKPSFAQPGFDITPALRGEAMTGLPLFSKAAKLPQTESPEFKAWFGDSKVVDAQGKPLVVYHGTVTWENADGRQIGNIEQFDRLASVKMVRRAHSIDTIGSWFSTTPGEQGAGMYGDTIYPVYLSIQNPHETTFHLLERRARLLANGKDDGRKLGEVEVEAVRTWLKAMGKDGVTIVHDAGNARGSTEFQDQTAWIALEPTQIKSAVGNRGTFDPNDPNILYSKAATESIQDMGRRIADGDLQREQVNMHLAAQLDRPDMRDMTERLAERAGFELSAIANSIRRGYHAFIGSGENRARASAGYRNVFNVMTHYMQRKSLIFERAIAKDLSTWVKGATKQDKVAVSRAMLAATVGSYSHDMPEYQALRNSLTTEQRAMMDQAWGMIGKMLDSEFEADARKYRKLFADDAKFEEWFANRKAQVDQLKKQSYFPERRYGDHFVHAYVEAPDGKKITMYYEQYEREAGATSAKAELEKIFGAEGLKVEYGFKHKAEYDGSLSIGQFLDLAQRHGISLTQTEKERLGKALIAADSTRRNRVFRRQNVAGYSQDGMRVLAEFAVSMANKVAYSEMGDAMQDALQGKQVDVAFTRDGTVTINTQEGTNVWEQDGPDAGFFRNLADEKVGFVMSPESRSTVSNKLRAMATVYFLGGSVAAAGINLSSLPMITLPWLTQHTNPVNASAKLLDGMRVAGKHFKDIRDLPTLLGSTPIEGVDEVEGLRHALQIAAQDGSLFDTEIYQFMGLSRGQEYSLSGRTQEAVKLWMTPFRLAEQYNRVSAFIAAYKVAKGNNLANEAAFTQAQEAVYGTQFRYDEANRPALADSGVGSLFFVFKSFPIFMMETMTFLAKENPRSAVFMLGMLVLMAGVEGLPFAEDLEDLIDVIAQRLFGEPFNSKRWLRNTLKSASEAVVGADLSGVLMHGVANSLTGLNFASRVGAGNLVPGTRIGAADTDYRRAMEEILGPVGSMVSGIVAGGDALSKGDFMTAAKKGLPLAAKNAVKGWEQFEKGYATDAGGRKLVDVGSWEALWQSVGFSSSALAQVYESDSIDRRTSAFYTEIKGQFTKEMVAAIRDGDRAAANEVGMAVVAWNQAHPDMPIAMSPASIRRQVALAGMPLNQRTLLTMPKYLRGQSEAAIGLAAE